MKTQFTLITNERNDIKLPHNNKYNQNIFNNSNVKHIKDHSDFNYISNSEQRAAYLQNQFNLKKQSLKLKANNKQLRTALESANIIAHNLKSPLMALELLLNSKDIRDSNKSIIRLTLNKIKQTAGEIQLLDTAISACTNNTVKYKVEMNSFVTDCFNEIKFMYEQDTNITFKLNTVKQKLNAKICPKQFKDALYNVVKNSYEAINKTGIIEISVNCHHDKIEVKVSDTGKGIPLSLIKNIGKKQFTFGKRGGSGIGIYHTQKILEDYGGSLVIRSIEEVGTQVSLLLPKIY